MKEFTAEIKNKKKAIEESKTTLAERKIDLSAKKVVLGLIDADTAKEVEPLNK